MTNEKIHSVWLDIWDKPARKGNGVQVAWVNEASFVRAVENLLMACNLLTDENGLLMMRRASVKEAVACTLQLIGDLTGHKVQRIEPEPLVLLRTEAKPKTVPRDNDAD